MAGKRRTTTKDVALLVQLRDSGQLRLAPEFQRNGVWPRAAKAYLIDTILSDRPIPVLYFQRGLNAQTNKTEYAVVDGQQRLRAVFEFMENKFSLTESSDSASWSRRRWKTLESHDRESILNYDFVVEELSGYRPEDITDMFARMNRYVVPLNAQELRHASTTGKFKEFVEELGGWPYWVDRRIFSKGATVRRRTDEFVSELCLLLLEGPQDKKQSLNLYYGAYASEFPQAEELRTRIKGYLDLIDRMLPGLRVMQMRRPANFYALVGALDVIASMGEDLARLNLPVLQARLEAFDQQLMADPTEIIDRNVHRYVRAASRQTDNLQPRLARITTLVDLLTQRV